MIKELTIIKISELSQRTGVSLRSIRYYEKQGILNPERLENGYRVYNESHVGWIQTIQLFISFGTSTDELSKFLDCQTIAMRQGLNSQVVIDFYESKLIEIKSQLEKLQNAEKLVEQQLVKWKGNMNPTIGETENGPNKGMKLLMEEMEIWSS